MPLVDAIDCVVHITFILTEYGTQQSIFAKCGHMLDLLAVKLYGGVTAGKGSGSTLRFRGASIEVATNSANQRIYSTFARKTRTKTRNENSLARSQRHSVIASSI